MEHSTEQASTAPEEAAGAEAYLSVGPSSYHYVQVLANRTGYVRGASHK